MKESESNICQVAVILEWMPGKSMYKYWGKNAGQANQVLEMTFEKDVNNWNELKAK